MLACSGITFLAQRQMINEILGFLAIKDVDIDRFNNNHTNKMS